MIMYIRLYPHTNCIFIDHFVLTPLVNLLALLFKPVELHKESGYLIQDTK